VYDSLQQYADDWATYGVTAWGKVWFDLTGKVGDKIAPLMGAPAGSVLVHVNASIANSVLFGALDFSDRQRNKVVITDMDFPSDIYVLRRWLPEHYEVHTVCTHDGISIDTDELLEAIDERTRLVSISHVLFRSAYIMPVQAVVDKAHAVGAQVVYNGYHSVGVIPVDVTALNVDFYIGGVLKWMCGGPGGVFMYVRPDLLPTITPKITGWFAHKRPFAFEVDEIELRDDSYRFLNGTFGVASLYSIQPGIDIIAQIGADTIRANSRRLTALVIELADKAGYEVRTPLNPDERAGTVTLAVPHAYEITRALRERNILTDYRENAGIRISPHFYTTEDEVRLVIEAIGDILETGAWQPYAQGRAFVT
ncbi:MAG: aminotransferase class V-fold PLP-dependent enzyme, partial [Acidobacteriales bacterium]|nr:aminotransferase class V-fold PLP-dependent enzyme [Terriglobales bacterium]